MGDFGLLDVGDVDRLVHLLDIGVVVDEGEDGLVSLLPDAARAAAVLTQLTSMIGDGDGGEMLVVGWTGGARSR